MTRAGVVGSLQSSHPNGTPPAGGRVLPDRGRPAPIDFARAGPFARGLEIALSATGPLRVDDTTAEGSAIADAFSRYLVATNLATSTSSEIDAEHYAYTFDVDWQQVKNVARRAGVEMSFDRDGSNEA